MQYWRAMKPWSHRALVGILLVGLCTTACAESDDQPAPQPVTDGLTIKTEPGPRVEDLRLCWVLFGEASPEQRKAAVLHLAKRYPQFTADILGLLARSHPDFYRTLDADLRVLVGKRYPQAGALIEQQISELIRTKYPQVEHAVDALIREKYQALLDDLRNLPEGPDQLERARALVRNQYPQLVADVLLLLRRSYPQVLRDLQQAVVARFPRLVFDLAGLVWKRYPDVLRQAVALIEAKAPGLLSELADILSGAPQAPVVAPGPTAQ